MWTVKQVKEKLPHLSTSVGWKIVIPDLSDNSILVKEVEQNIATVDFTPYNIGVFSIPFHLSTYTFPELTIRYYESDNRLFETFLTTWIKDIKVEFRVRFLTDIAKDLIIEKYSRKDWTLLTKTRYKVLPKGSILFQGSSEPVIEENSISFIAVDVEEL